LAGDVEERMNKDEKAALVEDIAERLGDASAIFAVDYRGISVPQAAELRGKLAEADATFRQHEILDYKGGLMDGAPLDPDQFNAIARLPGLDVLHGQLVGVTASPLTGLIRGLASMLSGLAVALGEIQERGLVGGEAPEAEPAAQAEEGGEEEAPTEAAAEPEEGGDGEQASEGDE
jgi:large subunit ribosomal protein L10